MRRWVMVACFTWAGCAGSQPAPRSVRAASGDEGVQLSENEAAAHDPDRHSAIERTFARKTGDLQSCWEEEYERTKNRKLEGNLTVQLFVLPSGRASDVKVLKSSLNSADPGVLDSCIVKVVSGWSFPEGSGTMPYHRTVHLGAQF